MRTNQSVLILRKQILKDIGFKSYQQYLSSPLWKTIRKHIWKRDCGICRACPNKAKCIHHMSYSNYTFQGMAPHLLVCLCDKHHKQVHKIPEGKVELKRLLMDTLEVLMHTNIQKGFSNPRVGFWFRNQKVSNRYVVENIQNDLVALQIPITGPEL
jgi:hypothetical protein